MNRTRDRIEAARDTVQTSRPGLIQNAADCDLPCPHRREHERDCSSMSACAISSHAVDEMGFVAAGRGPDSRSRYNTRAQVESLAIVADVGFRCGGRRVDAGFVAKAKRRP